MTGPGPVPAANERVESLLADLVAALARFPLRLLQTALVPIGLASLTGFALSYALPKVSVASVAAIEDFIHRMAFTFTPAAAAVLLLRLPTDRWFSGSVLLASRYAGQVLALTMLFQGVAAALLVPRLMGWFAAARVLFDGTGMGENMWDGNLGSGFAMLLATAIYLWPFGIALSTLATLATSLAVLPAAWRGTPNLPGLLLAAALIQAAFWGGSLHALDLCSRTYAWAGAEVARFNATAPPQAAPDSLASPELEMERMARDYAAEAERQGRPAVHQLGWLLLAPWIFVPAALWRSRKPAGPGPGVAAR